MDSSVIQDEGLYLMSNVQPDESGLPFVVYISEQVSVRPTIDVVAGELPNRDLALVRQWIELNRDVIDHWKGRIRSSRDVLNALRPLSKS